MRCVSRYEELIEQPVDVVLMRIKNGTVKAGKYAGRIKFDKNFKIPKKEGSKDDDSTSE